MKTYTEEEIQSVLEMYIEDWVVHRLMEKLAEVHDSQETPEAE